MSDRAIVDTIAGPAQRALRALLRDALMGRSEPVIFVGGSVVPAVSMWAASRNWVHAFRAVGIGPGDRVVVVDRGRSTTAEVTVACLWEGICVVPVAPRDAEAVATATGARVAVADVALRSTPTWVPDGVGTLVEPLAEPLPSSGRSNAAIMAPGPGAWVRVTYDEVLEVLCRSDFTAMTGARVVSAMDWYEVPGLLCAMLAPLVRSSALLVHEPEADDPGLASLLDEAAWLVIDPYRLAAFRSDVARSRALERCRGWLAPTAWGQSDPDVASIVLAWD